MQLVDLKPAPKSRFDRKRKGRGEAAGQGKTAGRGFNGQKSRSGGGKGVTFEGGQTPLARRLPKLPGFTNFNKQAYSVVNLSQLERHFAAGDTVDVATLKQAGLVKKVALPIKVLGTGKLTKKLTIKTEKISASAKAQVEQAGGKIEAVGV